MPSMALRLIFLLKWFYRRTFYWLLTSMVSQFHPITDIRCAGWWGTLPARRIWKRLIYGKVQNGCALSSLCRAIDVDSGNRPAITTVQMCGVRNGLVKNQTAISKLPLPSGFFKGVFPV